MEGIELKSQQHQAQRLQQLHDEEESFLRDGGDPPSHSHHTNRPTGSNSSSFSRDVRVCTTAYSRFSFPTRAIILFVVSSLLFYGAYEFGLDEGVKKENSYLEHQHDGIGMASSSGVGSSGGTKHADDINSKSGNGATGRDNNYTNTPGAFTKDLLQSTRKATTELVNMLNDYYGGEDVAVVMLAGSWQAAWKLDVNLFMDENDGSGANDDDDDVSTTNDAANDDDQSRRNLGKKKKVKKGKVLNDPDNMSEEQKTKHHHYTKQRTTKLITTMARALLNPTQKNFIIGTIGSSVAAGHDNCHYDCYESQLERTMQSVFEAADMKLIVQNAGEGGGCGDSHQNQVYCITHNISPNADIIHYSWTYFEKERAEEQREQLIRWGQRMQRRPMVHHLVARGKSNTCEGDKQENVDLDNTYAGYGYNAFCIQTGLYFGGHDYDTEEENGLNRFGWQKVGDGYHNTTRYGEELLDGNPRKDSLGTVFRNWHPGEC